MVSSPVPPKTLPVPGSLRCHQAEGHSHLLDGGLRPSAPPVKTSFWHKAQIQLVGFEIWMTQPTVVS